MSVPIIIAIFADAKIVIISEIAKRFTENPYLQELIQKSCTTRMQQRGPFP